MARPTAPYWVSLACCLALALAAGVAAVGLLGLHTVYPGDEERFIDTARQFAARGLSLDLLRHYEEMSGPLPFVLWGQWGNAFGFDLATMRISALLVAVLTLLPLHHWMFLAVPKLPARLLAWCVTVFHPYWVTMSLFVYTDMMALGFGLLLIVGTVRHRGSAVALGAAGALLCRQYFVFLVAGCLLHLLLSRHARARWCAVAGVIGTAPLVALVILWGSLSPDNQTRLLYESGRMSWHAPSLVLYVALLAVNLAPLLLLRWRLWLTPARRVVIGLMLSAAYWLWPVRPSPSAVEAGIHTVGLFHRSLVATGWGQRFTDAVFWAAFAAGLCVLWSLLHDARQRWRRSHADVDPVLLAHTLVILFLAVMPWSYLHWEKYWLPLLPLTAAALAAMTGGPLHTRGCQTSAST